MKLFQRKNSPVETKQPNNQAALAEMVLKTIHDGVIITNKTNVVEFMNPTAATMTGYSSPERALGLDYGLVVRLESKEGRELPDAENPLVQAMQTNSPLEGFKASLIVGQSDKRIPVSLSVVVSEDLSQKKIITFRNITRELAEEGEQTEFISTASHEMRTPIATIDGYLSLALNPQTAAIDERARGYLTAAQAASKHLGKLFQDLLDVTKLDDGRIRPHFVPIETVSFVSNIVKDYFPRAEQAKINLSFGSSSPASFGDNRRIEQVAYSFVDVNFMREILDNLVDNALKYTPTGGSIYINVRGDGDRVLINVTDTGMGISSDDLAHIFQKFYRADNSDTRTIGGTGLGLYLVKQRTEAMGGRVWAESAFDEGSTFYVSLPRLTQDEYEKRMIAVRNQQAQQPAQQQVQQQVKQPVQQPAQQQTQQPVPQPVPQPAAQQPVSQPAPQPQPVSQPVAQLVQPTPQPVVQPAPRPVRPAQPTPQPHTTPPQPNVAPLNTVQQNINLNGEAK